ncbi:MAG: hypothetical protein LBG26_03070 [Treponema sp.]|jgi:hypothetical protein|nr:hypothetical protein [Treponema sp.]
MAVTAGVVGAIAGVAGVGVGIAGLVTGTQQAKKANKTAQQQTDIAQQQTDISREQLDIQTKNSYLSGLNSIRDYEKSIADLEAANIQYGIDIRDAASQVDSYDKWLANYGGQYAQETAGKQAQTDQLMASGKESYENFLNAIGYSDALAGAAGRKGGNTSQGKSTGALDQKLVDYVGADRTLDANGGLYGSQLTAANLEMEQLKVDLDFQRQEMEANRANTLSTIADYQKAIELTDQSIANSMVAKDDLQYFIEQNFGNGTVSYYSDRTQNTTGLKLEGDYKPIVDYWKTDSGPPVTAGSTYKKTNSALINIRG